MPVTQATNALTSAYGIPDRKPVKELGKNEFLNLLVKQMQYQDPLQPMDNNEYIAQMAQLSTLEQMKNMTQGFERNQAFSMMGKTVHGIVANDELGTQEAIAGKVEKVTLDGSSILLTVTGGRQLQLSEVVEVVGDNTEEIKATEVTKDDTAK